jgi:hypothetical protein
MTASYLSADTSKIQIRCIITKLNLPNEWNGAVSTYCSLQLLSWNNVKTKIYLMGDLFTSYNIINDLLYLFMVYLKTGGMQQCSWLRHYATSRKVAGLSPDEVTGFFNLPNPSSCTMALGSTQPLTEMSTGIFFGCKGRQVHKADNLTAICEPTA